MKCEEDQSFYYKVEILLVNNFSYLLIFLIISLILDVFLLINNLP